MDEFQPLFDAMTKIGRDNPHATKRQLARELAELVREDEQLRRLAAKFVQTSVEAEIAEEDRRLERKHPGLLGAMAAARSRTHDLMSGCAPLSSLPFLPRG